MNRNELEQFIKDTYVVETNFPWDSAPTFEVFRHPNNQKWFALIMDSESNPHLKLRFWRGDFFAFFRKLPF